MESKLADEIKDHDVDKINNSSPKERLESRDSSSSSSSVRSSDFEDPFQGDNFETGEESALKSPPTQTMELPPESSGHRIPSHVFARNKSGNPGEWSINSNESLFSIQMGTTSFTHDQFSWLMKSGELNAEGYSKNLDPHHPTSENLDSSGDQISSVEPAESPSEKTNTEKSADASTTEIASTSNERATVNEEGPEAKSAAGDRKGESEIDTDHNSNSNTKSSTEEHRHSARGSDASGQSFAFPLLVADLDGGNSEKSGITPQEKSQEQTQPQPNTDQVQAETTEAAQSSSWFSRCVSFCSCR